MSSLWLCGEFCRELYICKRFTTCVGGWIVKGRSSFELHDFTLFLTGIRKNNLITTTQWDGKFWNLNVHWKVVLLWTYSIYICHIEAWSAIRSFSSISTLRAPLTHQLYLSVCLRQEFLRIPTWIKREWSSLKTSHGGGRISAWLIKKIGCRISSWGRKLAADSTSKQKKLDTITTYIVYLSGKVAGVTLWLHKLNASICMVLDEIQVHYGS